MAKRKRHDWDKIRKAYEAGLTQPEILLEFECPKSTLSERVKNEGWVQNELAKAYTVGKVELNEQKSELIELDNELYEIADNKANEISRRRGLIFNAVESSIKAKAKMLKSGKKSQVLKVKTYIDGRADSETLEVVEVPLNANDFKLLDEGLDKNAVTLEVAPRHANSQINVNTQNNQVQHTELNKQIVEDTLNKFEDEY